jgi:DNA end-binding protein Ku
MPRTTKHSSGPRAIWSGSIAFGLVNVPVRMYPAISEHRLELHLVHAKDGSRVGYQKVCKAEGVPVPEDEVVKAFELDGGTFVTLTDDDSEAAQVEGHKAIEILDFVPYEQIDPIFFERTYYLGPNEGAEQVYSLLVQAMSDSGLAAIGRYVFHERQQIGCLRIREGTITLEKMHFADEIRTSTGIAPKRGRVSKPELEMARDLIDRFTSDFRPERYEDVYRAQLRKIVDQKRRGREVSRVTAEEPEEPVDLMEALRASLESARGGKTGERGPERKTSRRRTSSARRTAKKR